MSAIDTSDDFWVARLRGLQSSHWNTKAVVPDSAAELKSVNSNGEPPTSEYRKIVQTLGSAEDPLTLSELTKALGVAVIFGRRNCYSS